VFLYGLPRGILAAVTRNVAAVSASSNVIELDGHGFETGDEIQVSEVCGVLPVQLVRGVAYYAIRVDDSQFKIAASLADSKAGTAIDLTTAGENLTVWTPLPFDAVLDLHSAELDSLLPDCTLYDPPCLPVALPQELATEYVATKSAAHLARLAGHASELLDAASEAVSVKLAAWVAKLPSCEKKATMPHKQLAIVAEPRIDPRGWGAGLP